VGKVRWVRSTVPKFQDIPRFARMYCDEEQSAIKGDSDRRDNIPWVLAARVVRQSLLAGRLPFLHRGWSMRFYHPLSTKCTASASIFCTNADRSLLTESPNPAGCWVISSEHTILITGTNQAYTAHGRPSITLPRYRLERTNLESIEGEAPVEQLVAPLIGLGDHRRCLLIHAARVGIQDRNVGIRNDKIITRVEPVVSSVERLYKVSDGRDEKDLNAPPIGLTARHSRRRWKSEAAVVSDTRLGY
jgi:hypothetical protein